MRFVRTHRFPIQMATFALAILLVGVVGCPKQEDFPAALDLVVPPTPANFVITRVDPDLNDYDFSWTVADPTNVDHYRMYLIGGGQFGQDELLFETPNTTYPATFGFELTGLQFAVSAVSQQGVEGQRMLATAP